MLMDFDSFDREQERLKKEQEALEREQAMLKQGNIKSAQEDVSDSTGAVASVTKDKTKQDADTLSTVQTKPAQESKESQQVKPQTKEDDTVASVPQQVQKSQDNQVTYTSLEKEATTSEKAATAIIENNQAQASDQKDSSAKLSLEAEKFYKRVAQALFTGSYGSPYEKEENRGIYESDMAMAYAFAMRSQDTAECKNMRESLLAKMATLIESGNGNSLHKMAKAEFDFVIRSAFNRF